MGGGTICQNRARPGKIHTVTHEVPAWKLEYSLVVRTDGLVEGAIGFCSTPIAGVSFVVTPQVKEEENDVLESDFYLLAKSYFDYREYRRRLMRSRTKTARKLCSCDDDEVLYMASNLRWLKSIQQVEQEVAVYCPFICHEVHSGMGSSKNYPISLLSRVSPATLSLILDYCHFHHVPGHSNKEMKSFDEKFIKMDTKYVCELTSAADSLKLKPLVDLTRHWDVASS